MYRFRDLRGLGLRGRSLGIQVWGPGGLRTEVWAVGLGAEGLRLRVWGWAVGFRV